MQTIDLGIAIRNAICIGKEVWTVDWKGNVTIRGRDDASKILGEIPTNKFVWAMAHMEPSLMWCGQEANGISLFDTKRKEFKACLTGGHSGGVTCIAVDSPTIEDEDEQALPRRRAWSGSNDFTIRQWFIDTWVAKDGAAPENSDNGVVVELGRWRVCITKGQQLYGHKNGVRALLKIGPTLWSGADDGTIRLWCCADSSCNEVIDDAHRGSVLKLSVVRSVVWSAGADGIIKEWSMGGLRRTCLRQVSPEGAEKGVYALQPLGRDVWVCGHHPKIQAFDQKEFQRTAEYEAHHPYVSNLMAVDRVETKVIWSTSLGDRKLKVWKHTIRGTAPNVDELKAANRLFEEDALGRADKAANVAKLQDELTVSAEEYKRQLEDLARELALARGGTEESDARARRAESELAGVRALFEAAGLGRLLDDPAALGKFLDRAARIEEVLKSLGLERFFEDPEKLRGVLRVFTELGLESMLDDPSALKRLLETHKGLQAVASDHADMLKESGFDGLLEDAGQLRKLLEMLKGLKSVLDMHGFGGALSDPSQLAEILSRYTGLQQACDEFGFPELFEDPYNLKGFLRNYGKIREVYRDANLEYLLDSSAAMREFILKNGQDGAELQAARERAAHLDRLEKELLQSRKDLKKALDAAEALRKKLGLYEALGSVDDVKKWKKQSGDYAKLQEQKCLVDMMLDELRAELERKERERLEALERERLMALKYKELDIFKLDIIARELKALDGELGLVGQGCKALGIDAGRLKDYGEQQKIAFHGTKMLDQCQQLRAHIRDVISKCLSETQKMHIGVALDDHLAAGQLKDGGVMAGYVCEPELPDHGNSSAAKLRQGDEMKRDRQQRRLDNEVKLPPIPG